MEKYIERFQIQKMWGRIDLCWNEIQPDVNILVGINGCGKTTLLNLIYDYYKGKAKKTIGPLLEGNEIDSPLTFIRSFDVATNAKKKTESPLLQELKYIINQNGEGTSFFDYRMKMLNFPEKADHIRARIDNFFQVVDSLFEETGKVINIDPQNNALIFILKETGRFLFDSTGTRLFDSDGKRLRTADDRVQLDELSSGEKQMLLILTTVFLQDESPNVLLMDEPEISLHIGWQNRLIGLIRELNPNCQLILTTHSPSMFANGWEDKIVFIADLEEE